MTKWTWVAAMSMLWTAAAAPEAAAQAPPAPVQPTCSSGARGHPVQRVVDAVRRMPCPGDEEL